ncbi:MAG: protein translocase subunit SecF [Oscillospiraceae bacterium]|jgi:SecD/SecF fusion protein|nr:protein translocase subunit SecF [Oscillospiraceae bacterium]
MKKQYKQTFFIVLVVTLLLSYVALFGFHLMGPKYKLYGAGDMRFGIDIRGGVDATFAPKDLGRSPTLEELEAARSIIETRLDQQLILDRDVTVDNENGFIFVRFPWKTGEANFNPDEAISELGSMAHLTFRDPDGEIVLEGKHVDETSWAMDQETLGRYLVRLKLLPEGRALFAEATRRLVGQEISIYMDDMLISSPTVRQAIDSNECVISDIATAKEATTLSNQINSGALPFSLITQNYSLISPSLGANALEVMVTAGIIAFAVICVALICLYRISGVVASIALLLQMAGQLIMLTWPQLTVTLPGIAGIILSIGMGVDANIIISERIREELRAGKPIPAAVRAGFQRAFSSVFDGNITVLIVAVIMLVFGSGAMLSFAYTLLFGIIMNFVAGVLATRLMMFSLIQYPGIRKLELFLSKKSLAKTVVKVRPFFEKRKVYAVISGAIIVVGIIMVFVNGVHLDIQFKGGSIVKYNMSETIELNSDDAANIAENAIPGTLITAQITTDYVTQEKKLVLNMAGDKALTNEELTSITDALQETYPEQSFELSESNTVSPFFGKKFLQNGIIAIALSAVLIIAYVWISFRKIHGLSAGAMALLSLFHDLLVVFFAFVIFQIPIGDSFIAVALTILGYSINDTIVIYDRIRENTLANKYGTVEELVNTSISQSFTRSLYTNLAVFLSVFLICIFAVGNGLDSVRSFAIPMAIGTISGCYSTVCIAGPAWTMWQKHKNRKKLGS